MQKQHDPSDTESLAATIGTKPTVKMTLQTGDDGPSGRGSARGVREFIFHPDIIKNLRIGETIVKTQRHSGMEAKKIKIRYQTIKKTQKAETQNQES